MLVGSGGEQFAIVIEPEHSFGILPHHPVSISIVMIKWNSEKIEMKITH